MNDITKDETAAVMAVVPVEQRATAAMVCAKNDAALIELAGKSKAIVAITNKAGHQECHAARMALKTERVSISKIGKQAREDATAFSKAVLAEENRLIGLIEPEELRLEAIQDAWEATEKAAKEARETVERARIAAIVERITKIKDLPASLAFAESGAVDLAIAKLTADEIDDSFGEYYGQAVEARADTLTRLKALFDARANAEAESARIKAEQEAEAARLKSERAEQERLATIERERLAAERAELDRQRAEQEAAQKEVDRIAAEKLAEQQAALRKEREAFAAEQAAAKAIKDAEEAKAEAERAAARKAFDDAHAAELARIEAEMLAEAERTAAQRLLEAAALAEQQAKDAAAKARIQAHADELLSALKSLVIQVEAHCPATDWPALAAAKTAIFNAELPEGV